MHLDASPPAAQFAHEALAVVLRVHADALSVLLRRRTTPPYAGRWALPGRTVVDEERLGSCVARCLGETIELARLAHLEQLQTRSDPSRDPRGRVLATAYLGLIRADQEPALPPDTHWHKVLDLPPLAFDHASIIDAAVDRLRGKLSYTTIAVALAPPEFTIATLRSIYSAALGHEVSATNLQRVLTRRSALTEVGATVAATATGGRPARLYRFTSPTVKVTDAFAMLRPPS